MKSIEIPVKTKNKLPHYATDGAAGADLYADLSEPLTLLPGKSACIPTGLFFELPEGYELQVRPRSGLALKHSVTVLNAPGTIDADYRGNVGVILINHGHEPFIVTPQMRIAQLVVAPVVKGEFIIVEELVGSARNEQGFGHTGYA